MSALAKDSGWSMPTGFAIERPIRPCPRNGHRVPQVQFHFVYQPGHQRQLFGGADRAADAGWVVRGGLLPRLDVLQRFGQIELFDRVIQDYLEAGA